MPNTLHTPLLDLLNAFGYRVEMAHMRPLARHLSMLARKDVVWSGNYLICVARGQLTPSQSLISAISKARRRCPPPPPPEDEPWLPPVLTCECGQRFIPNAPNRIRCYTCSIRRGE